MDHKNNTLEEIKKIKAVDNLKDLEALSVKYFDTDSVDEIEIKYLALLDSVQESAFRTVNFLWKRKAMGELSVRLSNYLEDYGDTDLRVKRIVVQYLSYTGQRNKLRRMFQTSEYGNVADAAIAKIRDTILTGATGADPVLEPDIVRGHTITELHAPLGETRTTDYVLNEYGKTWGAEYRAVKRVMAGEGVNSQAVLTLKSLMNATNYGLLNDPAIGDVLRRDFFDRGLVHQNISTAHRIGLFEEQYYAYSVLDIPLIAKRMVEEDKIDAIVELGSGAGEVLFKCFNAISTSRRTVIEFYGAEFTEAGREVADLIHSVQPDMNFTGVPFNYYDPDFSFIPDLERKRVLFFTNHSIEQIPTLPPDLLTKMLDGPLKTYCVHNEPVGWQFIPELAQARQENDTALFDAIRLNMTTIVPEAPEHPQSAFMSRYSKYPVSYNSAWWSYYKDYNHNLVALLQQFEGEGKLAIRNVLRNQSGLNPMNASTLIEWESA